MEIVDQDGNYDTKEFLDYKCGIEFASPWSCETIRFGGNQK
jgi:hypothetical protein